MGFGVWGEGLELGMVVEGGKLGFGFRNRVAVRRLEIGAYGR